MACSLTLCFKWRRFIFEGDHNLHNAMSLLVIRMKDGRVTRCNSAILGDFISLHLVNRGLSSGRGGVILPS